MLKTFRYRIYPTKEQEEIFKNFFDGCRLVYNLALETKIYAYKSHGVYLSFYDLNLQLTQLKKDHQWLQEVCCESLTKSIRNLDLSFKHFYNGSGFPKFKNKKSKSSFTTRGRISVNYGSSTINIPKIKNIKSSLSRSFEGKIKWATVTKTNTNKYFISLLVDTVDIILQKHTICQSKTIGIDLGIKHYLITSNGVKVDNPKYLRNAIDRLAVLQRRASRKKKGSVNRKKAYLKVSIQHERVANKRNNFLQNLSTRLISDSQATTFCVEDLPVSNMLLNRKLSKSVTDAGWATFVSMLKYKCEWAGKNLVQIGRFDPSSKTCSACGYLYSDLKLSEREWVCNECGVIHDRDWNAAINIRNSGLRKSVELVELPTVVGAMKQELSEIPGINNLN